jgi:hypothetical protein
MRRAFDSILWRFSYNNQQVVFGLKERQWRTRRVTNDGVLRLDFDRRWMLQFRGSVVTSDAGVSRFR